MTQRIVQITRNPCPLGSSDRICEQLLSRPQLQVRTRRPYASEPLGREKQAHAKKRRVQRRVPSDAQGDSARVGEEVQIPNHPMMNGIFTATSARTKAPSRLQAERSGRTMASSAATTWTNSVGPSNAMTVCAPRSCRSNEGLRCRDGLVLAQKAVANTATKASRRNTCTRRVARGGGKEKKAPSRHKGTRGLGLHQNFTLKPAYQKTPNTS
jgi:hypothetical protein